MDAHVRDVQKNIILDVTTQNMIYSIILANQHITLWFLKIYFLQIYLILKIGLRKYRYNSLNKMVRARLGENNTRITDDPAYMKTYMREYYQKNFAKAVVQVHCPHCGKESSVQKLKRHQASKLCKKRADVLAGILMEEEMETLRKIEEVEKAVEGTSDFKSFLNAFVTEKIVKAKGEGMTAEEFKVFFEDAIKIK